jgi:uncharacterized repeat protein (TIGR02543 family)
MGWTSGGEILSENATLEFDLTQDTIIVAVFGKSGTYEITEPGTLKDTAGVEQVTHLTLTGSIDARDVKFMRDNMPFLMELDLSNANVVYYEGEEGTFPGVNKYRANEMPGWSFFFDSDGHQTSKTTLTSVKLPKSVTSIGYEAFKKCRGLKELTLPESLTYIADWAFQECSGLKELTLPAGVTSLAEGAFIESGLSGSLTLPEGFTSIGPRAFGSCIGLKKLTLPASLTDIEEYAFEVCSGLTSITNLNSTPQVIYNDMNVFESLDLNNIMLIVSHASISRYQSAEVWSGFINIVDGGALLSVRPNNAALGSVSGTPNGFHAIDTLVELTAAPVGDNSFMGWTSGGEILSTDLTLTFDLTQDTIIVAVFGKSGTYHITKAGTLKDTAGVEQVTHLTLTGSIDARDVKFMRDNMPFLMELDLSDANVVAYKGEDGTHPENSSFAYPANEMPMFSFYSYDDSYNDIIKTSLTSVKLPESLTSIGEGAFGSCSGLEELTLPEGLTAIGEWAFVGCSGLEELTLPEGLTSIGGSAFAICSGLKELTLPKILTTIGDFAFYQCPNLSGLSFSEGLISIGSVAFSECSGLKTLSLPASLTSIGDFAFDKCTSLTSITNLNPTPQEINGNVFDGVNKENVMLTVSNSALDLYNNAEVWKEFNSNGGGGGITGGGVLLSVRVNNAAMGSISGMPNGFHTIDTLVELTAIPAEGYSFMGWTSGGETLGASNPLTFTLGQDTVITANFIASYTVTFDSKEGSSVESQVVAHGEKVEAPDPSPTRTGYTFEAWCSDEDLTTAWNFDNEITSNTTLYAKWEIKHYTVTFETYGGSNVSDKVVDSLGTVAEPTPPPTRTGYTFEGWYSNEAFTNAWNFTNKITSDTTLYAKWKIITYDVAFETYNGSDVDTQHVDYLHLVKKPATPTRAGYTFVDWYSDTTFNNVWDFSADKITSDTTLYAKWSVNTYTVTFMSNGSNVDVQYIQFGDTVAEPAAPALTGYTFEGWYKSTAFTNAWDFSTDKVTSDTTLYAKWDINTYTVTFDSNGGSSVGEQVVDSLGTVLEPTPPPTRDGYIFAGWYKNSSFSEAWNFAGDVVTANTTLYANWIAESATTYMVTFVSNGDTVSSQTVAENGKVAQVTPPARTGYTFVDWYSDDEFENVWDFSADKITSDTTLYAKWEINSYTVTFMSNGSNVGEQYIQFGDTVAAPPAPTRAGHTFEGWYSDAAFNAAWNFSADKVTSDTTLYAKWNINSYTVTFMSNGSKAGEQSIQFGSTVAAPAAPTRTGYTFGGWYRDAAFTNAWNFASNTVTSDTTLYAKWSAESVAIFYTVTFSSNDSTVNSQTVEAGGKVILPADPTLAGYTFEGWYSDAAFTNAWNFASNAVTSDTTLYAKWSEQQPQPPTGVESHTLGVAKVYPNPTFGIVTIESEGEEVLLYSLQGTLLKRASGNRLDLSSYPSGVYLLRAGGKAARIVKQ